MKTTTWIWKFRRTFTFSNSRRLLINIHSYQLFELFRINRMNVVVGSYSIHNSLGRKLQVISLILEKWEGFCVCLWGEFEFWICVQDIWKSYGRSRVILHRIHRIFWLTNILFLVFFIVSSFKSFLFWSVINLTIKGRTKHILLPHFRIPYAVRESPQLGGLKTL